MPIVNPELTQFNSGEITPWLRGRTDFDKYASSSEYMENCLPSLYGPIIKRSGTKFVNKIKKQNTKTILRSFIFSREQAYVLEIGVGYIRFHTKNGTLVDSEGSPIELATDFIADDLDNLDFAQSNDFLYIASGRLPVKVLKRYSHTEWTLSNVEFIDGPYQDENIDKSITIKASATTPGQAATLEASKAGFFTKDMIGMPIRLRKVAVGASASNAVGWGTITQLIPTDAESSTKANCLVEEQFFGTEATYAWRIGAFSNERGYAKRVTLHKGRLCLAATDAQPNTLWLSKADSYHDFGPTDLLANDVVDDSSITLTMATTETNQIVWLKAMKALFVGTLGSEFRIGDTNTALTPTTASAEEVSQNGSLAIMPLKYANELVYVQQAGRKIRTMYYDYASDSFGSANLSLYGEHLTHSGIAGLAQQIEPEAIIWTWLNDGQFRSVSYDKDQKLIAWSRQVLGGRRVRVLSGCSIPFIEEHRDQVYLIVERWINNKFVQYIETIERIFDDKVDQKHGYFVDCGGTYDNPLNISNMQSDENNTNLTIITVANHGLATGAKICISDIEDYSAETEDLIGYEQLNEKSYTITKIDDNSFSIEVDSSEFPEYISWQAGKVRAYVNAIVSGLDHLEGETVWAVVDGAISPKRQVINGRVNLDTPGTIVHVGLPYKAKYKSVRLDVAMGGSQSALAAKQKIHQLYIQVYRTNYFLYGEDNAKELQPARKYGIDKMDTAPSLKTELIDIPFEATWGSQPHLTIESDLPLPLCILSITPKMSINT